MNIFASNSALATAYAPSVGVANYVSWDMDRDIDTALAMAALQPGENVLDLGCAGGKALVPAKRAVKTGVVVGVDAVQALLDTDATAYLQQAGLTVAPAGSADQQVHLLRSNVTDRDLLGKIRLAVGSAGLRFHAIFLLHVFGNLPIHQRRALLLELKAMLHPGGRLLIDFATRIPEGPTSPADHQLPVQFRHADHTEIVGRTLTAVLYPTRLLNTPGGRVVREKFPWAEVQVVPDRYWLEARRQAIQVAININMRVTAHEDIAKGNDFGLPTRFSSPPQADLDRMTMDELRALFHNQDTAGHRCVGRVNETICRRRYAAFSGPKPSFDVGMANTFAENSMAYRDTTLHETQQRLAEDSQSIINMVFIASAAVLVKLELVR